MLFNGMEPEVRLNADGLPATHEEIAEQNSVLASLEQEKNEAIDKGEEQLQFEQTSKEVSKLFFVPELKEVHKLLEANNFNNPLSSVDDEVKQEVLKEAKVGLSDIDKVLLTLDKFDRTLANQVRLEVTKNLESITL